MTRAAAALGIELVALPTWYDVDDAATLARLVAEASGAAPCTDLRPYAAPVTREYIRRMRAARAPEVSRRGDSHHTSHDDHTRASHRDAGCDGATLVALVVAGLAALDWDRGEPRGQHARVAAFVASICLAGLLLLLAAATLRSSTLRFPVRSTVLPRSSRYSMSPVNDPTLADATPSRTERSMTVTAIKDPRRYSRPSTRGSGRQPRRRCVFILRSPIGATCCARPVHGHSKHSSRRRT